jgi:ATP-binding cassette subfamily B protein
MEGSKRIFEFTQLRRVFTFAAPYKRRFYMSVGLAVLLAVLSPVRPLLIQYTINNIIKAGLINTLLWITVIQAGILFIETGLRFFFTFLTAWLGQTVVKDLRVKVYEKVLNLNLSQFDRTPIGTLTTRTINDIESINDIFSEGLIPIIADFLSIIAILAAMFYTNWLLTLVCLIPFPFLIISTYIFKESVNKSFRRVRNAVSSLNAFVQEHITGMQIVQAFSVEDKEYRKFRQIGSIEMLISMPFLPTLCFSRSWRSYWPARWDCWFGMQATR